MPGDSNPRSPLPAMKAPRVVIEKAARRLSVFDGPRLICEYPCAFGPGRGDKVREGDRCTPEGRSTSALRTRSPSSRSLWG